MSGIVVAGLLLGSLAVARDSSELSEPRVLPEDLSELPSPMECPVGAETGHKMVVTTRRFGVEWEGKTYYLANSSCLAAFVKDPGRYARPREPRSALFRTQSSESYASSRVFLGLGLFIFFGVLTGGWASYVALHRGHNSKTWFAIGFLLSLIGVALAATRRKQAVDLEATGSYKLPQTREPRNCPQCGAPNHPAADHCLNCGASLRPAVESEVRPGEAKESK